MHWIARSTFLFLIAVFISGQAIAEEMKSTDKVAAAMTSDHPKLRSLEMVPNGAAVITSSGALSELGIKHIIHAAPGSMNITDRKDPYFEPTIETVKRSVANSLTLARQVKIKRLAIPLIGGGVWLERMKTSKDELAKAIVDSAVENRGEIEIVFVGYKADEVQSFRKGIERSRAKDSAALSVAEGNIAKPSVHQADAIVNAANMEVLFGGGGSGAVAEASQKKDAINREANLAIQAFWRAQK